jgi:NAD(P) transhydrogenase
MARDYDLVVVGAGPAGQSAAEVAATFGRRTLVIDRDRPGGVVTSTGGAPTKTLREAAVYLTGFGQDEVYGVHAALPLTETMSIIGGRIAEVRERLQDIATRRLAALCIDYAHGGARLLRDRVVQITGTDGSVRQVSARSILIASGSRPTRPRGIAFDDPDVYDTDRIYAMRTVPAEVVIVGGGPVGVEFATVFTALGIPVTVVSQADRLLPDIDGEMSRLLADELHRRGVKILLGTGVDSVARVGGVLTVGLSTGAATGTGAVLFAAGRTPNTEDLGLAAAGVDADARGRILVDIYLRTTAAGIYAAGDVVTPALASTAMQQGRAAACHACGLVFGLAMDEVSASAVYGLPEVAGVGVTEEQALAEGVPHVVGRCDLADTVRGAIAGHGGRLKLVIRADNRRLLGVHCIGEVASEVVGLGHLALRVGTTVETLLALDLNTPTYSYAYHDAAIAGLGQLARLFDPDRRAGGEVRRDQDGNTGRTVDDVPDPHPRTPRPGLVGVARGTDRHSGR